MSVASEKHANSGGFGETVKVVVQALILALLVRTFLFQPFNIPSGSMEDTLLIGDYLFVSKYSYGYSRFSLPFGPHLFDGRIWSAPPKRGDIVVFKLPRDNTTDYIKRVIGLPGDRIQMINGVLNINGTPVKRERIADFVSTDAFGNTTRRRALSRNAAQRGELRHARPRPERHRGQHPGLRSAARPLFHDGRQPRQLDRQPGGADSGGVGYVPFENLVGRAEIIFFSVDEGQSALAVWKWPWIVRWNRLFKVL